MLNHFDFFSSLYAEKTFDVNNVLYIDYVAVMKKLNMSLHDHQAQRRQEKYPNQFIRINGRLYISARYSHAIYQQQINEFELKKMEGGSHE